MNTTDIPIWEKYMLTIEEAAKYFRIGESKLRRFIDENPNAKWVLMNGNRSKACLAYTSQILLQYQIKTARGDRRELPRRPDNAHNGVL